MLTFLFWNLKQARPDLVGALARGRGADVVMLAECPAPAGAVLRALNRPAVDFTLMAQDCRRVAVYTRLPDKSLTQHSWGNHYTILRLGLPGRLDVLLCIAHFPSKLYQSALDQFSLASWVSARLAEAEAVAGHARTVLVGDLNMNPYEDGVVAADGLHAVMTREIASRPVRKVKYPSNLFFYNPMWGHFGEQAEGHAGTYYYATPKQRADYWNIYDQVLVRPALLPLFPDDELEIVHQEQGANVSLLRNGFPDDRISDHLPILFRLDL